MMFAPQPIQVRYGDGGVLAAGAAGAGANAGYGRQKASDMAFINAEADRRQNAEQFGQQQQMGRLQLAQQLAVARLQGNPTDSVSARRNSPLTAAVQNAKKLSYQSATQGVDLEPEQDALLQSLMSDPSVDARQFDGIATNVAKSQTKLTNTAASKQSKDAFLKTQPQEVQDQLGALASDDSVDLSKLRIAASDIVDRTNVRGSTKFNAEVTGIDNQMRPIQHQMEALAEKMQAGVQDKKTGAYTVQPTSPFATPASFNPVNRNPDEGSTRGFGFWGNLQDALTPFEGNLVSGGNSDAMQAYTLYYQLKNQLDALQAQRAQVLQGQGQEKPQPNVPNTPQTKGSKQITVEIAKHFKEQAGGDKTKARQMALDAGYSF